MNKLEDCIGGTFKIIGTHPHAGKTIRVLQVDTIKGCKEPGALCQVIRGKCKGTQFRVFNIKNLVI